MVEKAKNRKSLLKNKAEALSAYRLMLLVRRFEERAGQLYGMGLIGGFCHLYIGQEAVVAGVTAARKEGDTMITSYRDHGHMLAVGAEARGVMAELTGRAGGCSKGKGGSMHMFDLERGFYGGHGIVGAQVPLGNGLAFAHKYKNDGGICFTFYGEGAANQGQVYESLNMAGLWSLPIIYVIENNRYAMGTSVERSTALPAYHKRGEALGVPGIEVDGQDVDAVYQATLEVSEKVRKGSGPFIMEIQTYRYRGHSMSDPAKYREKKEVDEYRQQRDPVTTWKDKLLKSGVSEDKIKAIDVEIKEVIDDAIAFSKESPEPDLDQLFEDILCPLIETQAAK